MDKTPASSNLALVSPNYEDVVFCVEVCQSSGLTFQRFDKIEQAAESVANGGCSALFADVRDEEAYQRICKSLGKALKSPQCVLAPEAIYFLTGLTIEQAPYLIHGPSVFNYVLRNYKDPKEAGHLYGRLLKTVISGTEIGLAGLLGESAKIKTIKPTRSGEKEAAIEDVLKFLEEVNFHPRIASKIAGAADELLMNAIFDAPTDADGKSMFGDDHTKDIPLDGKHSVEMQVGFDGKYAAVLVSDHFGSLDPPRLLEKLAQNYSDAEYVPSEGLARAGLGIFTVFHSGGSLFFLVRKSARTDALVFFRNTETFREFREQFRFFTLRSGRK